MLTRVLDAEQETENIGEAAARLTRESERLPDAAAAAEVQKRLGRARIRELGPLPAG